MNLKDYVPAFVNAYYTTVMTEQYNVKHFYSPNSTFYRPYMNSNSSEQFNPKTIAPRISPKSILTIKNFVSAPIPKSNSISVTVSGHIQNAKKITLFSQYFILQEIGGRICIISDIFNEFSQDDLQAENQVSVSASDSTTAAPPNSNANTAPSSNINNNNLNNNNNDNSNNSVPHNTNTNNNSGSNNNRPQSSQKRNKKKNSNFVYTPGKD